MMKVERPRAGGGGGRRDGVSVRRRDGPRPGIKKSLTKPTTAVEVKAHLARVQQWHVPRHRTPRADKSDALALPPRRSNQIITPHWCVGQTAVMCVSGFVQSGLLHQHQHQHRYLVPPVPNAAVCRLADSLRRLGAGPFVRLHALSSRSKGSPLTHVLRPPAEATRSDRYKGL